MNQPLPPPVGSAPTPTVKRKRRWPWIVGGVAVLTIVGGVAGAGKGDEKASLAAEVAPEAPATTAAAPVTSEAPVVPETAPSVTEAPAPTVTEAPAPAVTEAPAPAVTEAPAPAVTEAPAPTVTEAPAPILTPSQENAVESAQSYLDFMAFSRQGLIDQLTSEYGEQFPEADAVFAVDYLNPDWMAEAVESAESYLDFMAFSRQGLIDQLTSEYGEQFTSEQATFAATQVGLV